ncbi:uncharacterized protein FA14DRAFT_159937 [Meira miltonrushii]|uniref:Uncharacterized protein n=1 Tax=Meira miltonrushii TaxID=1280837 RepID=A0A316VPH7_9BASI|nr:uncharacterized protein FA14DRAFT_159937 [Meira miltonrushii]PWN38323.1 hypothetical protein FA14DRAFT_159937 [Meira miltonrushii]
MKDDYICVVVVIVIASDLGSMADVLPFILCAFVSLLSYSITIFVPRYDELSYDNE